MHFIFDASSKRTIHPNKCRQLTFLLVSMIKLFDLILIEMKWQFCICLDKLKQDFLFFLTNWINPQPWFAQVYSDAFVSYIVGGSESLTRGYTSLQYWCDIIYEKPLDSLTEPWQFGLHTTCLACPQDTCPLLKKSVGDFSEFWVPFLESLLVVSIGLLLSHFVRFRTAALFYAKSIF